MVLASVESGHPEPRATWRAGACQAKCEISVWMRLKVDRDQTDLTNAGLKNISKVDLLNLVRFDASLLHGLCHSGNTKLRSLDILESTVEGSNRGARGTADVDFRHIGLFWGQRVSFEDMKR